MTGGVFVNPWRRESPTGESPFTHLITLLGEKRVREENLKQCKDILISFHIQLPCERGNSIVRTVLSTASVPFSQLTITKEQLAQEARISNTLPASRRRPTSESGLVDTSSTRETSNQLTHSHPTNKHLHERFIRKSRCLRNASRPSGFVRMSACCSAEATQ